MTLTLFTPNNAYFIVTSLKIFIKVTSLTLGGNMAELGSLYMFIISVVFYVKLKI